MAVTGRITCQILRFCLVLLYPEVVRVKQWME